MARYIAIPKSTHLAVVVATGATIKSVLQVATPATTNIRVLGWGVSFQATSGTPGICTLVAVDVAATVTALTPDTWGSSFNQASLCIGGTSATGYNASAEGSVGASRIFDAQLVSPAAGYSIWFPTPPVVPVSRFLRIRCTFGTTVNVLPWIVWEEPA